MAINFPNQRFNFLDRVFSSSDSSKRVSAQPAFQTNVLLSVGPDPSALLLLIGTAALSACSVRLFSFGTGGVATTDAGSSPSLSDARADAGSSMDMTVSSDSVSPDATIFPDRSEDAAHDASWPEDAPRDGGVDARVVDARVADALPDVRSDMSPDAGADAGSVFPSTLVGWWPLDGNLLDFSGRGNNLTFFGDEDGDLTNNFITTGAPSGEALSLDGADDYAQTAEPTLLGFSDRWTIGFWLYLGSDRTQTFFSVGNSSGTDAYRSYVELLTNEGVRDLSANYYGAEGVIFENKTPPGILALDTWQHITITNSGGSAFENLRIYLDCISQPLTLIEGELTPQSDLPRSISIGHQLEGGRYVNGAIDEFVIYNTDLDETAVSETFCR